VRSTHLKAATAGIALSLFLLLPTTTQAQLVGVSPDCGDGTVMAYPGAYSYTDCSGAWDGNNSNQQGDVLAYINANWESDWTMDNYVGKGEADPGPYGPFTYVPGGTSGTLDFPTSYTGSFVLILKGSNAFSMYYFQDRTISGFEYDMAGVNPDGQNGLSHASLWYEEGGTTVPEPATIFLLGSGLLGVGFVGYRRRKQQD